MQAHGAKANSRGEPKEVSSRGAKQELPCQSEPWRLQQQQQPPPPLMPHRLQMVADGGGNGSGGSCAASVRRQSSESSEVRLPPMWENHHLNPFPEDDEAKRREMV